MESLPDASDTQVVRAGVACSTEMRRHICSPCFGLHGVISFCHSEGAAERACLDFTGTSEPLMFRSVDPARTGTESADPSEC